MNQDMVLKLARDSFLVTLQICLPLLGVSLVIGVFISIVQIVTSIQDMTLSFVPRIVAVLLAFLFLFPWMMNMMIRFTFQLYGHLDTFAH